MILLIIITPVSIETGASFVRPFQIATIRLATTHKLSFEKPALFYQQINVFGTTLNFMAIKFFSKHFIVQM
jgi:hypothetical protein